MLLAVFANFSILFVIMGYSFLLKKIFFKKKNIKIENKDLLYGFLFIIFISLIVNFFSPLNDVRIFFNNWICNISFCCF